MSNPIVSICCITYNHAPFIRKALDGFLMQLPPLCVPRGAKMSDWCEILIHDDASTDGTDDIIREYTAKYPDLIFPLYEEVNQYAQIGIGRMDLFNYLRAKGKYIAYCEGDDYWIEPHKLQKQVDFLETHPDYSICFHACRIFDTRTKEFYYEPHKTPEGITSGGIDVTSDMFLVGKFGAQPLTMVMRRSMYDMTWPLIYPRYSDTHEVYNMLRRGKGYFMAFIGGVYHRHNGGVTTSRSESQCCEEVRDCFCSLYMRNKDDNVLRSRLVKTLLWNYDVYKSGGRLKEFNMKILHLFGEMPLVILRVLIKIMKKEFKCVINLSNYL